MVHKVARQELAREALACELVLMRTWLRQKGRCCGSLCL